MRGHPRLSDTRRTPRPRRDPMTSSCDIPARWRSRASALPKQHTGRASHAWAGQLGQRHRSQRTGYAQRAGPIQHVVPVPRCLHEDQHPVANEFRGDRRLGARTQERARPLQRHATGKRSSLGPCLQRSAKEPDALVCCPPRLRLHCFRVENGGRVVPSGAWSLWVNSAHALMHRACSGFLAVGRAVEEHLLIGRARQTAIAKSTDPPQKGWTKLPL